MKQAQKSAIIPIMLAWLTFSLLFSVIVSAQANINIFKGNVTIGGSSSTNGAVSEAFIGSASSSARNYTVGSLPSSSGQYVLDFPCDAGSVAFLKVWGINATWQTCVNQFINFTNLSVSLVAEDGACSYANACSGGFCCSSNTAINTSNGAGFCQSVACGTGITFPSYALSASSITTAQTINFTINITNQLNKNITAANFTVVVGTTVSSKNFTIPSNSRNLNISYQLSSSEVSTTGTYNITAVQINDNGSITNRTVITNMNFTVTAAAAATTDTGGGGSSSGGSGGGSGGGAAGTPSVPPPSESTKEAVQEALPESFKTPEAAGNVVITAVSAPEVKQVLVSVEAVTKTLEQAEAVVKTEEAKQALSSIQEAVSSGGASTVTVSKTIEVVKATNKATKEEVVVSVVKLSVTAPTDKGLKNVEIIEVIPKAAASNVNQVTFKGEKPVILEADPVVKWFFAEVAQGQKKDLSYIINKDIRAVGTTTVGVSGRAEAAAPVVAPPPPPPVQEKKEAAAPAVGVKKPTLVSVLIMVAVLAVAVVGGWLFLKGRKKVMR